MDTATPAPSAPAPTATVEITPPSSVDAALDASYEAQAAASAPADPGSSTTPAPEPVPATAAPPESVTPPVQETVAQPPTEKKAGVPPETEWPRILENARTKSRDETIAQVRQEIGPHLEVVQRLRQDFTGTLEQMITEGLDHPTFGPPLVAILARHLAARRGKGQAPVDTEEPPPDLQSQDGEPLYSARQQAKHDVWLRQQIAQEQDQKIAPLLQTHQRAEAVQQAKAYLDQRVADAKPTAREWEKQPHFNEHKAAILQRQASLAQQGHEPWSALGIAYAEIVNQKVLPSMQAKSTTTFLEQAAAKSRGSTPNPASSAPVQPQKGRSVDEALDLAFAPYVSQ